VFDEKLSTIHFYVAICITKTMVLMIKANNAIFNILSIELLIF
ncbi:MAG: hypothetical protein ACI9TO_001406, partial [Rickettsiales bacterium]